MEKMNDEQLKRELPFDLYGRYAIIRDIIDSNRKGSEKLKILDVGGRGNRMKLFLPKDDVFFLDPLVETKDANFIEGDGCAIPREDESFDWVVSADVFEHIPSEKRNDFLKENIRVAKLGVVLAAPFDSEEVRQAEINANENYKLMHSGEGHAWLKEHIANGLPSEKKIEDFARKNGLRISRISNNRLFLWEMLQGASFFVQNNFNKNIEKEFWNFNYFYNSEVFPYDSAEPSYRKIFFIKKSKELNDPDFPQKKIDDLLFLNTIKKAIDLLGNVDIENKKLLNQKDAELLLKKEAIEKNKIELENALTQLASVRSELVSIYSSREWKAILLLQKYIKVVIPNGSSRRKLAVCFWRVFKSSRKAVRNAKSMIFLQGSRFKESLKPRKSRKINFKSKKIVFIAHSYHAKTRSADFLLEYLRKFFDVEVIFDDSWQGKKFTDLSFVDESYFAVIFWQLIPSHETIKKINNENIVFLPMYGGVPLDYEFWSNLRDLKFINFSKTLHEMHKKWGLDSMYIQYFTDLQKFIPGNKNEVFFWQRLTKININTITKLFGKEKLKIHIHRGVDPEQKFVQPSQEVEKKFQITYTDWFESRNEMLEKIGGLIRKKGIYVAPRDLEGIGMSFLEAMAMGKAVIAVDNPTMNEYIEHGKTGYLFDLSNPKKIDLSDLEQVQKNAYEFAQNGRKKWEEDKSKIIDFMKKK